ncbi:uncharacterized protein LOC110653195 [Hevea brasiliensis]|uniref:uncharacterized protein LOC110653195 n=1 Tax=Hevea brasiliensis TaxID=3981 RepID=UPI002600A6B2|nr:uncharacterized protein LOC110653195 [Hevea brasiliensis]
MPSAPPLSKRKDPPTPFWNHLLKTKGSGLYTFFDEGQFNNPICIQSALASHDTIQKDAFKILKDRKVQPTRYISAEALQSTGLFDNRRKLQKKSAIVFPVEPETDEAPTNTFKSGHIKTDIVSGIDDSVESSIISGEKCEEGIGSECHSDELVIGEDIQIRELCISVLRSHGLLVGDWCKSASVPTKIVRNNKGSDSFQSCELCVNLDNTLNMLLCDHCEKAFHAPCCNPKTKMSPTDEWFCQSCSKLAGKVSLEASFMKSQSISCCNGIPEFKWGPIALMLKYPEPYTSRPRIGGCFQATVPEWSDQMSKDFDSIGEPLELDPAEIVGLHGCPADKYLGAISNWLQCQEVLYDGTGEYAEGTICGKWHR